LPKSIRNYGLEPKLYGLQDMESRLEEIGKVENIVSSILGLNTDNKLSIEVD